MFSYLLLIVILGINTRFISSTNFSIIQTNLLSADYYIILTDTNTVPTSNSCADITLGPISVEEPVIDPLILINARPAGSNLICSGDSSQLLFNVTPPYALLNYYYFKSLEKAIIVFA